MRKRVKHKTDTNRRSLSRRPTCCNRKVCKFSIRTAILPRLPIKTIKSFLLAAPRESSHKSNFPAFSETSKRSLQRKPRKTSSSNHRSCSTVARSKTLEWYSTSILTMGSKRTRLSSGRVCWAVNRLSIRRPIALQLKTYPARLRQASRPLQLPRKHNKVILQVLQPCSKRRHFCQEKPSEAAWIWCTLQGQEVMWLVVKARLLLLPKLCWSQSQPLLIRNPHQPRKS